MAEKEYIEREKIGLTDFEIAMCNGDYKEGMKMLLGKIDSIPAADVRPVVKAHFNLVDGYSITALGYDIKGLECSNCGATFIAQSWVQRFHFCPSCGATMEES